MSNFKLAKKLFMEAFQWAAFATPLFVTGQRFATMEWSAQSGDNTRYWLLITASIAYVAGITLVVWLPVKIFIVWKKVFKPFEGLWFPGSLMYVVFCAIPCAGFVLAGHENCDKERCFDYFTGAPIETLVIMLVVTGSKSYPNGDVNNNGRNASVSSQISLLESTGRRRGMLRRFGSSLKWTDARPENLLRDLLHAYDARLILDLGTLTVGNTAIFQTGWVYPVYILTCISFLPLAVSPNSDMRSSLTVLLQDIPFFILRFAIYCTYGSELVQQSSVLFLLKNFFITFAFVYFNCFLPRWDARKKLTRYNLMQNTGNNISSVYDASKRYPETNRSAYQTSEIRSPIVEEYERVDETIAHQVYALSRNAGSFDAVTPHFNADDVRYRMDSFPDPPDSDGHQEDDNFSYTEAYHEPQYPLRREARYSTTYPATVQNQLQQAEVFVQDLAEVAQDFPPPPEEASPASEEPPPQDVPKVIDYDTLHNPRSFLYSQERTPVQNISFSPKAVSPSAQQSPSYSNLDRQPSNSGIIAASLLIGQTDSPSNRRVENVPQSPSNRDLDPPPQLSASVLPEPSSRMRENTALVAGGISATKATESISKEENPQPSKDYVNAEPIYAKVDKEPTKRSRRVAPAPPIKPKTSVKMSVKKSSPPPPPTAESANNLTSPPKVTEDALDRTEASTPVKKPFTIKPTEEPVAVNEDLAQKLALEALQAVAVNAMEEAAKYGEEIGGDWSTSTTPKNTYSNRKGQAAALSLPRVNDETFDVRL